MKAVLCLTLTNVIVVNVQAWRDVYIMVYGIPSHLVNLLATGIL